MSKKKTGGKVFLFLLLLALVLVMLYCGLQILEPTLFGKTEVQAEQNPSKTIVRDGQAYFPRQDLTVVMVLGIDQYGPVEASNYYRNDGSADSVMLLVFDETAEDCTVLYLNRDTMLEMDVLGVQHEYAGTTYAQLALAHTYGNGLEESSDNVKNTLMKFLPGCTIDYYVAMNMDAIPILNDAVGGVTVNVTDDFSKVNPSITMGEITLHGEQVIDYVRTRKDVGDQSNVTRMQRQREYVNGFLHLLYDKAHGDVDFMLSVYEDVAPYIVSDCSASSISSMLSRYGDYTVSDAVTPEGENKIVDGHYEFHVDEESLDALILDLFYTKK